MYYLVYPAAFHRTARAIAEASDLIPVRNVDLPHDGKLVINWGCTNIPNLLPGMVCLNEPNSVHFAVDKVLAFRSAKGMGLNVPQYYYQGPVVNTIIRDRCGWGARDLLGYIPIRKPMWVEWLNKRREFSVYFIKTLDGTIKKWIREKVGGELSQPVWNRRTGFTFQLLPEASESVLRRQLYEIAIVVQRGFDLYFGAVDCVLTVDNDLYFLEVNTAPRLQPELYPFNRMTTILRSWRGLCN